MRASPQPPDPSIRAQRPRQAQQAGPLTGEAGDTEGGGHAGQLAGINLLNSIRVGHQAMARRHLRETVGDTCQQKRGGSGWSLNSFVHQVFGV